MGSALTTTRTNARAIHARHTFSIVTDMMLANLRLLILKTKTHSLKHINGDANIIYGNILVIVNLEVRLSLLKIESWSIGFFFLPLFFSEEKSA